MQISECNPYHVKTICDMICEYMENSTYDPK
jgi:hypothetical protein